MLTSGVVDNGCLSGTGKGLVTSCSGCRINEVSGFICGVRCVGLVTPAEVGACIDLLVGLLMNQTIYLFIYLLSFI